MHMYREGQHQQSLFRSRRRWEEGWGWRGMLHQPPLPIPCVCT